MNSASGCKLAVAAMQPYFLPYLGYFTLASIVDDFVFLDDVQYIRRGWINRNRIKNHETGWSYLTVPTNKAPQQTLIRDIQLVNDRKWRDHTRKSIEQLYSKSNFYADLAWIISPIFDASISSLLELNVAILKNCFTVFNLTPRIHYSSSFPSDKRAEDRIVDICKVLSADVYWNLPGGMELYQPSRFQDEGITLNFVKSINTLDSSADDNLDFSILDLLLELGPGKTAELLKKHKELSLGKAN